MSHEQQPSLELLAAVTSSFTPLRGQGARSSWNFPTCQARSDAKGFFIKVTNNPNAGNISFDVMEDRRGRDRRIWSGLKNGSRVDVETKRSLYIAKFLKELEVMLLSQWKCSGALKQLTAQQNLKLQAEMDFILVIII